MVRAGIVIVVGAVIFSMALAMSFYVMYQPNLINVDIGEQVKVGPNRYVLTYQGVEQGSRAIQSDSTFIKVDIITENEDGQAIPAERKQFELIDKYGVQTPPTHGVIDDVSSVVTAYFPISDKEFDDQFSYKVILRPTKNQSSTDIAIICITNCN